MNCPKCNGEFEVRRIKDVSIYECRHCHGIWFERAALQTAEQELAPSLCWVEADLWKEPDHFQVTEHALLCPSCQVKMASVRYEPAQVTVDVCTNCRGVWLDKGEFEQIITALEGQVAGQEGCEDEIAALEEARRLIADQGGFISEWRGFTTLLRMLEYRILVENPKVEQALVALSINSPFH